LSDARDVKTGTGGEGGGEGGGGDGGGKAVHIAALAPAPANMDILSAVEDNQVAEQRTRSKAVAP